jgi:hypothetical protein
MQLQSKRNAKPLVAAIILGCWLHTAQISAPNNNYYPAMTLDEVSDHMNTFNIPWPSTSLSFQCLHSIINFWQCC